MTRTSALMVSTLALASSLLVTACPGDDDDNSFPDGGSPAEAGVAVEASADEHWQTTDLCTKEDGAEVLGGAVNPSDLVLDGNTAWFLDRSFNATQEGKTSLWTMAIGVTRPGFVRSLDGSASALQQHGDRLYWVTQPTPNFTESDFLAGELWSMPKSGGEPSRVLQGRIQTVVVTPDALMVSRMDHIQRVAFDGTMVQDIVPIDNAWCPLLVRGNTLAWMQGAGCGDLWVSDLDGQNRHEVANLGYLARLHALDDAHAYVSMDNENLGRIPLAGGTLEPIDNRGIIWPVLGGGWLYWSDLPEHTTEPSVLRRFATSGGAVQDFVVEKGYSFMLGADDTYAYFADEKLIGYPVFCIKRKPH